MCSSPTWSTQRLCLVYQYSKRHARSVELSSLKWREREKQRERNRQTERDRKCDSGCGEKGGQRETKETEIRLREAERDTDIEAEKDTRTEA